jgi:hypothetical protein
MIRFIPLRAGVDVGYLPTFFSNADPRPAKEQINERHANGGGWNPMEGWSMNPRTFSIRYPGDRTNVPLACTMLRDELIVFYEHSWLAIIQMDNSFEISRVD